MKKAYLVHGWGERHDEPIHLWIKEKLEKKGYEVSLLKMPNPKKPTINSWTGKLQDEIKNFSDETILIGHSIGCQTILRFLQSLKNGNFGKVFLISPWTEILDNLLDDAEKKGRDFVFEWLEKPLDWNKIKKRAEDFICFFSDDDFMVPLSEVEIFEKNLDAKILILENRKHFDRRSGIKDLPEILDFIK